MKMKDFICSHSQMFFEKGDLKNFANFSEKHLCCNLFCSLKACNFIKKRLQDRCFPVKFSKFLRTPFFTEHLWGLLLRLLGLLVVGFKFCNKSKIQYCKPSKPTKYKKYLINQALLKREDVVIPRGWMLI